MNTYVFRNICGNTVVVKAKCLQDAVEIIYLEYEKFYTKVELVRHVFCAVDAATPEGIVGEYLE